MHFCTAERLHNPRHTKSSLALGVLWGLACALETWFLTFLRTRIACEETSRLERAAQIRIAFNQGAGNAEAHSPCLTTFAATIHMDADVDGIFNTRQCQGL